MLLSHSSALLVSTDVAFFETTLFSLSSTITSLGDDVDLLVYYVSLLSYTLDAKTPQSQIQHQLHRH